MKAISLGIISSIIFSIVLAKNSSGSGSTTGCFSFLKKKAKKSHKTTAEPVKVKEEKPFDPKLPNLKFIDDFDPITLEAPKGYHSMLDEPFIPETDGTITDKVTGFLRREHVPGMSGWYIRPYEEDYEDKIKVNYIPYREYYERKQKIAHKQNDAPPSILKGFEKQEFPKEQKSSTINEDALFLGNRENINEIEGKNDEIYKKNMHLLCTDPEETAKAVNFMNEAVIKLEYYATHTNDNESCERNPNTSTGSCENKDKYHKDVIKNNFKIDDSNKYNKIINKLWDLDSPNSPNFGDAKTKIVRVYYPNLVMIQRRYKPWLDGSEKYFYALATKVEISKDKIIIVMASGNINDHNSKNTISYKNPIIESANLFEADVNSEEDIRSGKLIKTFVNISGHLIEKKDDCVDITYVMSVSDIQT
ncbi:fam-a protein [Plasmodium vinckei lentum]|uniref:Fam-a protein n=1 Tax=Plasmodium vinckei lentum TaxID=138297 RepID=A0A6V7S2Y2_PLAVN|nr:fam-a protein [Plasmodium vinckei lentum]